MESKSSKLFFSNKKLKDFNIDPFKELEFTEVGSIASLPPEPVSYVTCPVCDGSIDYKHGSHPVFYFRCNKCNKNIKVEVENYGK